MQAQVFVPGKDKFMKNIMNSSWSPKEVADEFQAYLVQDASFTSKEEYPILRKDMISTTPPKRILPFSKAINSKEDLSDTFICTFSPDNTFKRVLHNPKRYVDFFKRTAGLLGFDFSIHSDMPIIKQKKCIDDNLSLTYFYGNQGIPIIPNLRCGIDELLPEFLETIPHKSMVAIGTHGFIKYKYEKYEWYCFLNNIIPILNPSTIIVYGSLKGKLFDEIKKDVRIIEYEPWSTSRRKGVL